MVSVDVDVLVVGAGPVGLTAAVELARRGVSCRLVDRLAEPVPYAKAVGVQPRTLELWDAMGLVRGALDAAEPLLGQRVYVNGDEVSTIRLALPPDVPYGFAALPQYEVERLLTERLAELGGGIDRAARLVSFEQDGERVLATLERAPAKTEERVSARYLIGCDGAHSTVRKGLGLSFEGDAFPEEYMIGDLEVDWSLPRGYAIRAMHQTDGQTDDLLVCVPLPGHGRYRMSMRLPAAETGAGPAGSAEDGVEHGLQQGRAGSAEDGVEHGLQQGRAGSAEDGVEHGLQQGRAPSLADLQAVLDRLSPEPVTAGRLRWSSVFRISHRLVDRYADGRVFVAGDAAHIHPPTGGQGMNTGIQDAYNLAWKLALAVRGEAAEGLLASYEAERLPVAEEVVGRTVRHARAGMEADPDDPATVLAREAQLLVGYPDSPLTGHTDAAYAGAAATGVLPGGRAPDCRDLRGDIATYPLRMFDLLRGTDPALLLYAPDAATAERAFPHLAARASDRAGGHLDTYAILPEGVDADGPGDAPMPPVLHDTAGRFRAAYAPRGTEAFLIRPDGYLGTRVPLADDAALFDHLNRIFAIA